MRSYSRVFQITVEAVPAEGDEPAGYVAINEELGLVVEADTLDSLAKRACKLAGELFKLNILPTLRAEATEIPPAFILHHRLNGGLEVLS